MSSAMDALRRSKLVDLLNEKFGGNRGRFLDESGITKGRLSQLLDPKLPFGATAARNLEQRLQLPEGYFDSMDARTVDFALQFERLPSEAKAKWEELVKLLAPDTKS